MVALTFPGTPDHLDTYTDHNQAIWQYDSDGPFWNVITSTTRKLFSGAKLTLAGTSTLSSTSGTLGFNTVVHNVDAYYTAATPGRITVPTTGYFRVQVLLFTGSQGNGASYTFTVRKNGSESLTTSTVGPNQTVEYDETMLMDAGDYIEITGAESTNTGTVSTSSTMSVYRLGFSPGTGVSNHNAFSGVKAVRTNSYATSSTPTAVQWQSTDFNVNANVLGDVFWALAVPNRITSLTDAYYKLKCFIQTSGDGSSDSYTITLRKNGSDSLFTVDLSANDTSQLDELIYLNEDDFLELMVSNSDNTGAILSTVYLELVREGV